MEVLEGLNPQQQAVLQPYIEMAYSGPLPPAHELAGYDRVIPNGADRIMAMAEREQEHRHKMDDRREARLDGVADLDKKLALRGQAIGAALMIVLIAAALVFAYLDKFPQALGTVLSAVAVQVGAWALNRASRQQTPSQQNPTPDAKKK
ncbi:MAG TPA: DUF2335 domain-containing protein [Trueperaceae bacterium]